MIRTEAEVERLVRENQKLVDYMVNRYLKRYFVGDMEREERSMKAELERTRRSWRSRFAALAVEPQHVVPG